MEETHPRPSDSGVADASRRDAPISSFAAPADRSAIIRRGRPPMSAVSVVAPAGYGKTVLLEQWAGRDGRLGIPVPLSAADADPATLTASVAAAFARALVNEAGTADGLGVHVEFASIAAHPGSGRSVLARTAVRLQALIVAIDRPFVVLVDDADHAAADACQDVLEVAFARIPPGSLLVVAGRIRQPFLSRLRVAGRVADVGAADLALDAVEMRRVFDGVGAPTLSEADAVRLRERTEGWAAGIALAAIIARDGGDPLGVLGDDGPVAEFLQRAVVASLSADELSFARESAVFDPIVPAECDAVLGRTDSAERLRALESRGLLLAPLDVRRTAYRYHPLFREFLLGGLARSEPSRERELHRAAARRCEDGGRLPPAIDHLLAAGDREHAARLVAECAFRSGESGDRAAVDRWLGDLGDAAIAAFPPLMVVAGWWAALDGRPREADRWDDLLGSRTFAGPAVPGFPPFASARALLRVLLWRHGLGGAVHDATCALQREPMSGEWRDHALLLHGWTLRLGGDPAGALAEFEEACRLAAVAGHATTLVLSASELARFAFDAGARADADRHLDRALGAVDAAGLDGTAAACLARAVAARRALRRYDRSAAERLVTAAMRDRGACTYAVPVLAVEVRIELCRAHLALGDPAAAAHLLHEIDDVLWLRPGLGALEGAVDDLREDVRRNSAVLGPSPLTPAELRLLPLLQTHLTIAEIAARLFVSRNTAGTQIGAIYRKLGVTTRSAAVERAAEVGLLG
ncbi:LuxR family transcriptional regulator [Leifsonia soli]|uniref:LuxR family maltose regulon positive regulatory protein n=1 Tax=Leifsonia soli TaxID=582665 RepID=A0A852SZX4_9MICO|nr:LuxR family transcriptional regulator [Leifsonia soli]NYD74808.1 LuxR family maltose regulon positive regulatory protein [Leifsonia soli]